MENKIKRLKTSAVWKISRDDFLKIVEESTTPT
jgi:CRP-like cAMP-binding protein